MYHLPFKSLHEELQLSCILSFRISFHFNHTVVDDANYFILNDSLIFLELHHILACLKATVNHAEQQNSIKANEQHLAFPSHVALFRYFETYCVFSLPFVIEFVPAHFHVCHYSLSFTVKMPFEQVELTKVHHGRFLTF